MSHRAFGAGEINQELRVLEALLEISRHVHTTGFAQPGTGVVALRGACGNVQGTG